ncbi:bifunctional 2-polyprenyl-6-hydroxyphenol methylase/3-demethylubiquinol 3-O-methyltransferase UbiG [Calothrix sp. PCC 7507]|uniref:class I SAM-dependent methyltransferase n=1 Tax=Calothrix sp. PCC 7507 TaxID=99598 RepID=UPI00029F2059|nr:class I SAM-dependent methyltransferase [Calothrix sp. PCC 7507]AFY36216.1 Methyltransferase type 11 [Calothrix sp. PCC 7507]
MNIKSPLTQFNDVELVSTLSVKKLIDDWQQAFQIKISDELYKHSEIQLYRCNQTRLLFFHPFDTAGSDKLYEQLEKFDWYYMPRKWEHDVAIEDLQDCKKVLEVGCGQGAFVERLCKQIQLDAVGIELNSSAVNFALNKGIPVIKTNLDSFSEHKASYFDAVCTFQVLEHVSDPFSFIESMLKLIKPGGKLIISVPNSESFSKYSPNNLLDQPPHHMTRWCQTTFDSLTTIFPLKVEKFRIEPLAKYHVEWYLSIQIYRLFKLKLIRRLALRSSNFFLRPILKNIPILRNPITGHTLYVVFTVKS